MDICYYCKAFARFWVLDRKKSSDVRTCEICYQKAEKQDRAYRRDAPILICPRCKKHHTCDPNLDGNYDITDPNVYCSSDCWAADGHNKLG